MSGTRLSPMNSTDSPERGDLWLAALGAARPGEPGKTRPVLILTPGEMSTGSARDLFSVVPISSSAGPARLRPRIDADGTLHEDSVAVVRAVRSVARQRLVRPVGRATEKEQSAVDAALLLTLGLVRTN
jgi:mRNA interferase MazF